MSICHIICAGEEGGLPFSPADDDYVIAADGGLAYAERYGIRTDAVIGDFDSLGYSPEHGNVLTLPVRKNDTDTLAAVRYGLDKGYRRFRLYCALGGRSSHTVANIQTLAYIALSGGRGEMISDREVFTVIRNSEIDFPAGMRGEISVFSLTEESHGVRESGLEYPADGITVTSEFPIGVSNAFTGAPSSVGVEDGMLLIIYENDRK